jgi:spore maturation protein CgeB
MKVLFLTKYYTDYLEYFYNKSPEVLALPYDEQKQAIDADHFGWTADFSNHIKSLGIESLTIITNNEKLQKKWALENNFKYSSFTSWEFAIVVEQIRRFRPDILWVPNPKNDLINLLSQINGYYKKLFYFLGHEIPNTTLINKADVLITNTPKKIQKRHPYLRNIYPIRIGFNPSILSKIGINKKKNDVIFAGSIMLSHSIRAELLAYLIEKNIDLKILGSTPSTSILSKIKSASSYLIKNRDFIKTISILKSVLSTSEYEKNINIIKTISQSPVFGLDYYRLISQSRISLNIHIDLSTKISGNMRMFESTGVGTCLLTDEEDSDKPLFIDGKEILTFGSKEELLERIRDNIKDRDKLVKLSKAGQKRTMENYTIEKMFSDIHFLFNE